ncbi:MAG: hypothetical protein V2A56_09555 [bacterium]
MANARKNKVRKASASSKQVAVGISVEGRFIQMVKVAKIQNSYQILDARLFELDETLDMQESPAEGLEELGVEVESTVTEDAANSDSIEISEETGEVDLDLEVLTADDQEEGAKDDAGRFVELLQAASNNNARVGISLTEPQIFYNTFDTDWGLKSTKLKKRIKAELVEINEDYSNLRDDALSIIKVSEERPMVLVREGPVSLIEKLEEVKGFVTGRLPFISFVESLEISLANLVRHRYDLADDAVTAVVYVGEESSRFIFMRGHHLHHIAPVIADGANSPNIGSTLSSRFLFELDTLDLPGVDTIVLAGFAHVLKVEESLKDLATGEIHIEAVNLDGFDLTKLKPNRLMDNLDRLRQLRAKDDTQSMPDFAYDSFVQEETPAGVLAEDAEQDLTLYAGAIGVALRILDRERDLHYEVDLTPLRVKEGQNRFGMTFPGWILLGLIPLVAGVTYLVGAKYERQVEQLKAELGPKQEQMVLFNALTDSIRMAEDKLIKYERSFSVIDSLVVGTKTWSNFLTHVVNVADDVGGFWFTDMNPTEGGKKVNLVGYSLYRNRIPRFIEALGGATLKRVEVQEIREKRVYKFEIEALVPRK